MKIRSNTMPFGRPRPANAGTNTNNADNAGKFFPTNTIRTELDELRTIYLLPDPKDPQYPEEGVPVYTLWQKVHVGGQLISRKLFMDKATKDSLPKGLFIFYRVFMNVYDLTPVILVQSDPNDPDVVELAQKSSDVPPRFYTGFKTKEQDKRVFHEGKATPNKRIMILEASHGLVQQLEGLPAVTVRVNEEGESVPVNLLDIQVNFAQRLDNTGKRQFVASGQAITAKDRPWYNLPRYDLSAFKPWPGDAIHRILGGEDFDKIIEEYKINRIPKLVRTSTEEGF